MNKSKLLLLMCLVAYGTSAPGQHLKFDRLDKIPGLENRSITSIIQDDLGFMWFGSQDGLIRYDGYEIRVFKNNIKNRNSIADNNIRALAKDLHGNLWIATQGGGLDKFDLRTETFTHFRNDPGNSETLSGNAVWSVFVDSKGFVWAGTFSNGLNRIDPETNRVTRIHEKEFAPVLAIAEDYHHNIWFSSMGLNKINVDLGLESFLPDAAPGSILPGDIQSLCPTVEGKIWIGTVNTGIHQFEISTGKFSKADLKTTVPLNSVYSIREDRDKNLWIGGSDGLAIGEVNNPYTDLYRHNAADKFSISTNSIRTIYTDREGITWIGTEGGGVNKLVIQKNFQTFRHSETSNSISHNLVRSIMEDSHGQVWIGTQGGGLNILNLQNERFEKVAIEAREISSLFEDEDGTVWIGSWGSGLFHKMQNGKILQYKHSHFDPNSLPDDRIQTVRRDKEGVLWVATENGLSQFYEDEQLWIAFEKPHFPEALLGNNVQGQAFLEGPDGSLWVGTWFGLNIISPDRKTVKHITADSLKGDYLSSEHVISLYADWKNEIVWVGTFGGGLNRVDVVRGTITHFLEEDGLPNNTIFGMRQDAGDYLWLSTNNGLSRFNPATKVFRNFDVSEGLQGNEFFWGAVGNTKTGLLLFGGVNGLNIFDPSEIRDNINAPPIVITNLEMSNKTVAIRKGSILEENVNFARELTLDYDQTIIGIHYAALNYNSPEKNQYAYFLENFDEEWNYVGNKRSIYYTHLSPGNYKLHIRGSNNDQVWNEEGLILHINIVPPFWRTWWFLSIAISVVIGCTYYVIALRLKKIKSEKEKLRKSLQREIKQAREDLEAQKVKMEEEQKKNFEVNWSDQSLSILGAILSKSKHDLQRLCQETLVALVKRCELLGGAVYVFDEPSGMLLRRATCGFEKISESVARGAGQVGECFDKKETIVIDNLPADFIKISSGLGSSAPKVLAVVPLRHDEICVGVIELASFDIIPPYRLHFIEEFSSQLAATINTTIISRQTEVLLQESKIRTEEMKVREEELKQNLEEMEAIQDDFTRRKADYEQRIKELENRLNEISEI